MIRLILAVSVCRCRSLPNVFIQCLLSVSPWARSLSASASETSARKGIPRSAATVLARRKMASGISNVVFIKPCSHIYGSASTGATFSLYLWQIGSREIVEMSRCNDNSDGRTPVSDRNNKERIVPYSAPKGAATAEPLGGELVMGDQRGTILSVR